MEEWERCAHEGVVQEVQPNSCVVAMSEVERQAHVVGWLAQRVALPALARRGAQQQGRPGAAQQVALPALARRGAQQQGRPHHGLRNKD